MPSVSKKQQKFFGYLLSNPEERKKKGISKKAAKDFAQDVKEGEKKGLWDNIHAKRKRGEKPAKPGDKDYPKTLNVEGAAWTKKSGKNPEGGLNEKGRKSYERENPGSDLKAPQPEGGSRKKSFCARMGGMKKKLTSSKTANDPDSRINKALRKWKCNEVAPPGWGHTKAEKEKTKPWKPKSKIGGSSAAFDRARKEGRFKGSKEDMFKIMWWMYNKGGKPKGKPHYKPGTDEKYKKYQDKDEANEEKQITPMQDNNLFGNAYAGTKPPKKKKKLKEASFRDYMDQAQAARDRLKKKQDDRKKKDAEFVDRVKKGVKFYDKKGSGRIVKGRKVYD
jgi:hypothetical protein